MRPFCQGPTEGRIMTVLTISKSKLWTFKVIVIQAVFDLFLMEDWAVFVGGQEILTLLFYGLQQSLGVAEENPFLIIHCVFCNITWYYSSESFNKT